MSSSDSMTSFESSLTKLEQLVSKMEQGQLTLEQSLEAFEEGVSLTKQCQTTLKNAEQRVSILLEQNGELNQQAFTDAAPSDVTSD